MVVTGKRFLARRQRTAHYRGTNCRSPAEPVWAIPHPQISKSGQ